jgi:hypothetical protein
MTCQSARNRPLPSRSVIPVDFKRRVQDDRKAQRWFWRIYLVGIVVVGISLHAAGYLL